MMMNQLTAPDKSLIKKSDFIELQNFATTHNLSWVDALSRRNNISTQEALEQIANFCGLQAWTYEKLHLCKPRFDLWPLSLAEKTQCVFIEAGLDQQLHVLYTSPFNHDLTSRIERVSTQALIHGLTTDKDLQAYLRLQESQHRAIDQISNASNNISATSEKIEILSLASASEATSPAVRVVNSTLFDALRAYASDIHLESTPDGLTVKYRIDGMLDTMTHVTNQLVAEQVISRIKVMADLDISERRIPQDGSFQVNAQGRMIDLRVSIMPSVHGEDAVIRILDKQSLIEKQGQLSLESLGFDSNSLLTLRKLANAAYGMLLVTGPTGSGKTTTLYAALAETYTGKEKIITIEDPVEYQLNGILQIPVNEKKGLTFARGLRSILRHDPDKIMIGEIRDKETAEIAVQSALTGHLVLSSVHANSVFDVFSRFMHMGLDSYALVSALNGVWAQRLIRVNCPHCAQPYLPHSTELDQFELSSEISSQFNFKKGIGCGECRGTGYRGRRAIAEILQMDDELREMIVQRQSIREIKQHANRKGIVSLQQAALDLAKQGFTTLEEVRRVTLSL